MALPAEPVLRDMAADISLLEVAFKLDTTPEPALFGVILVAALSGVAAAFLSLEPVADPALREFGAGPCFLTTAALLLDLTPRPTELPKAARLVHS